MYEIDDQMLDDLRRLPVFNSSAVLSDEPDDNIASVKMTVGDIRTIRRIQLRLLQWPLAVSSGGTTPGY